MKTFTFKTKLGIVPSIVFFLFCSLNVGAQATYELISFEGCQSGITIPFCPCDSIKCLPPDGEVFNNLSIPESGYVMRGDTIIVQAANILNFYFTFNSGNFHIRLRPQIQPYLPSLTAEYNVCGVALTELDAENQNPNGFPTSYLWSDGQTSQTIMAGVGNYSVTVSNTCGSVTASTSVVNNNTNAPDLGPDIQACAESIVTLTLGTGYDSYLWFKDNSTLPTLDVNESGTYIVEVTNTSDACIDRDTVVLSFVNPPETEICFIEFDELVSKNKVVWAEQPANVEYIYIYKAISSSSCNHIATVPASQNYYTDMSSNPQNVSCSYRIATVDTCGNIGTPSDFHKTITLLSSYDSNSDTYGFSWSSYLGIEVENYFIYGVTSDNQSTEIGCVCGNSNFFNYQNPSPLFVHYYVGFYTSGCISKSEQIIKSNYVSGILSSINENANDGAITLYPNPSQGKLFVDGDFTSIEIFDVTGRLIRTEPANKQLDLSMLAKDTYFVRITNNDTVTLKRIVLY